MATHVDDWLETAVASTDAGVRYAAFFLHHKRLSAAAQNCFREHLKPYKLYCDYQDKRYRCTGASRLGDVWLHSDRSKDVGYELRVDVDGCTNWGSL